MLHASSSGRYIGTVFKCGNSRAIRIPRALWELGLNPPLKISFNVSREGDGWSIQIAPMGSHLFSRDLISESLILAEELQECGDTKGSQLVAALVELIRNPSSQEEQS